jgi:hypothetical protein
LYLKSTTGIEVEYLRRFSRRKIPRVYPSNIYNFVNSTKIGGF